MGVYAPVPALITLIVGAVTCIIGGLLYHFMPVIIMNTIERTMTLSPDTDLFKLWESVPVPIYSQFYIFNYTNHLDFLENWQTGVKPVVQEVGPYTYRQSRRKIDVKWTDGDSVEYKEVRQYHFVPEMSVGSEDDVFIIPNIPLATITQLVPEAEKPALKAAIQMINATVFVNQAVGKLLYHGYRDTLVDLIQFLTGDELLPDAMFGFFYGKNNTDDGIFRINRGNENSKMLGAIISWNNASQLQYWPEESCNLMKGSDGSLYSPDVQKDNVFYAFKHEICRSVPLRFTKEVEFKGVDGYQLETDFAFLGDSNIVPDNKCFCYPNASYCAPSGVLSLSACRDGAPVVISHPHFLMAAQPIWSAVDGLHPNYNEHNSVVQVEPLSGTLLKAQSKMQTNLQMKPVSHLPVSENLPDILLPVFWVNESFELTDELVEKLRSDLYMPIGIGEVVPLVILAVGACVALLGILCAIGLMFKSQVTVLPFPNEDSHITPMPHGYINTAFKN